MSHTATTTISRYFTKSRGKALSTGWFGLSTAEFILPVLIVYLLAIYNWKHIWITISLIVIIFLPIASYFLIKNLNFESRETQEDENSSEGKIKDWKQLGCAAGPLTWVHRSDGSGTPRMYCRATRSSGLSDTLG